MRQTIYLLAFTLVSVFSTNSTFAQGMAINATGATADASAMLDVASTSKGMLVPRMSATQRTSISSPANGLLVYDNTLGSFYYNSGTSSSPVWTVIAGLPDGSASGDMLYWNGSAWTGISAGSNGQFLSSASGVPTWATLPFYPVTASSGANGTISPVGISEVFTGGSQVYTITPSSGYTVDTVTVDGSSVGAVTTYTFTAVSASHTISATFH